MYEKTIANKEAIGSAKIKPANLGYWPASQLEKAITRAAKKILVIKIIKLNLLWQIKFNYKVLIISIAIFFDLPWYFISFMLSKLDLSLPTITNPIIPKVLWGVHQ